MGRIIGRSKDERGASLVEYALLVALIAVVCIGAVTFLGSSASGKLDSAGNGIAGQGQACLQRINSRVQIARQLLRSVPRAVQTWPVG